MIEFFKRFKTTHIIISILVIIILLQNACNNNTNKKNTITTVIDTVWSTKTDTIVKKVKSSKVKYVYLKDTKYQPSKDIDTCFKRFTALVKEFSAETTYKDTIRLDSLGIKGNIQIEDIVFKNKLKDKRKYIFDIKIPTITETITITKTAETKKQLYFGGNLFGDKTGLQLITPGLIYKTKKDQIYQANLGVNFDGSIIYGAGMYWKIKL
jgi:hypothetical protein